ncbi:MAG: sulfotransferase family protein [Verrucomicrobia bacterium]|nr:sulfotransferase family protein [Verrucomicrobiota bacterium]
MSAKPDLRGWLPVSISKFTPEPVVDWCRFGTRRFTESFFDHTAEGALRDPFNLLFRHKTPLDTLLDVQREIPGMQPAGLIFHMSRCGSTLVSQMLAALPGHIVLSEPPPVDSILRTDRRGASDEQRIAWLRAWMSAASQPRNGEERLFVKLDAWHTFDLPLLRRAFPGTPWIFLFRNPVEVMVSAMKEPGGHLVPNPFDLHTAGIALADAQHMSQAEYIARALAALLRTALEHIVPLGGKALEYPRLPDAVFTEIAPHFNLTLTAGQIEAMNAKTAFHAKAAVQTGTPQLPFEPDAQSKQKEAGDELRALCAMHLDPLCARLRAL